MGTTVRMILAGSMLIAFPARGHAQESDAREERTVLANDSALREAAGGMPRQNARAPLDFDTFPTMPVPTSNIVTRTGFQNVRAAIAEGNVKSKKVKFVGVGKVYFGPQGKYDPSNPEKFTSNKDYGPRALNMEHPAPVDQTWIAVYFCRVGSVEKIRDLPVGITNEPGTQVVNLPCN